MAHDSIACRTSFHINNLFSSFSEWLISLLCRGGWILFISTLLLSVEVHRHLIIVLFSYETVHDQLRKKAHHQFRCPSATLLDRWYEKFKPIMMTWGSLCQLQLPTTEMTVSVWFLPKWCFALNSDISTLVSSLQRTQRSISLFRSRLASLKMCCYAVFWEKRPLLDNLYKQAILVDSIFNCAVINF